MIKFDGVLYTGCDSISSFSNDSLLMEFKNIIEPLYTKDNLENIVRAIPDDIHLNKYWYKKQDNNEYCIKISIVRGNKNSKTGKVKDDFYTIISNNKDEINRSCNIFNILKQQKNNSGKRLINFYIPCGFNKQQMLNTISYLMTDFCRTGLLLKKFNMNMYPNIFNYIPWFDFSNPIFSKSPSEIDDYLFKTFKISDEIRKHIEEILPDYYGIRKGQN